MGDKVILLKLNNDEALVLLDLLAERDESEGDRIAASGTAEEIVLWRVEGQLEKALTEIFDPRYAQLVEEARKQILENHTPG